MAPDLAPESPPSETAPTVYPPFGKVFGETFLVFGRNLIPFTLFGFLCHVPFVLMIPVVRSLLGPHGGGVFANGLGLISLGLSSAALQCVVAYGVYADLSGKRRGAWQGLRGLKRLPAGLLMAFLLLFVTPSLLNWQLASSFLWQDFWERYVVLIVIILTFGLPLLSLFCMWFLGLQVVIVERKGVSAGLDRSAKLTKGWRWGVLGIVVTVYGLQALAMLSLEDWDFPLFRSDLAVLVWLAAHVFFYLWTVILQAVAPAVVYANLRRTRESAGPAELLRVFD